MARKRKNVIRAWRFPRITPPVFFLTESEIAKSNLLQAARELAISYINERAAECHDYYLDLQLDVANTLDVEDFYECVNVPADRMFRDGAFSDVIRPRVKDIIEELKIEPGAAPHIATLKYLLKWNRP